MGESNHNLECMQVMFTVRQVMFTVRSGKGVIYKLVIQVLRQVYRLPVNTL